MGKTHLEADWSRFPLVALCPRNTLADLGTLGCQEMLGLPSPTGQASGGKQQLLVALEISVDGGH